MNDCKSENDSDKPLPRYRANPEDFIRWALGGHANGAWREHAPDQDKRRDNPDADNVDYVK